MNDILFCTDTGQSVALVLLDILITRLEVSTGLRGMVLQWFR